MRWFGEAAGQILIEGAPHVMVSPNLFVAEIQVFVIQPVSAGECVQHSTAVQLARLRPEWLDLRRGLHRERTDERGLKIGTATDETAMRGFWAHYRSLMEAA